MDIKEKFGTAVREKRLALGLSQEELAMRSGLSQGYLSLIEAGNMNVTLETMDQVAKALNVEASALLPN